jgi:hypothetical protein
VHPQAEAACRFPAATFQIGKDQSFHLERKEYKKAASNASGY